MLEEIYSQDLLLLGSSRVCYCLERPCSGIPGDGFVGEMFGFKTSCLSLLGL